jgi:ubiquitin carboxyl-terminal hydrolase 4/11/15
MWIGSS